MVEIDRRSFLGMAAATIASACSDKPERLRIAAAASTAEAIEALLVDWQPQVEASFAASSTLARQIEAGAPFDLFISADPAWIDRLEPKGLVRAESRRTLFSNRLALAVPSGRDHPSVDTCPPGRVAIGDPSHVPLGRYTREALEAQGWWEEVEQRMIVGIDARATARLVEIGEADWGVTYLSDAVASAGLEAAWTFPASSHRTIRYELVTIAGADPAALELADWLSSPKARSRYASMGFQS